MREEPLGGGGKRRQKKKAIRLSSLHAHRRRTEEKEKKAARSQFAEKKTAGKGWRGSLLLLLHLRLLPRPPFENGRKGGLLHSEELGQRQLIKAERRNRPTYFGK